MSNSFALLGGDDGFQQVPSKKSRKKKNRSQDQNPAAEASVTPSSAPSEVSEETAGAPSDAFQQVHGCFCHGLPDAYQALSFLSMNHSAGRPKDMKR